jgi:hypothetical protein
MPFKLLAHRGDITLATEEVLVVPRAGGVLACKPTRGFTADTVSILRRGLTATTANQNVKQRRRERKFLLGKQGAASPPRRECRGFRRGKHR